MTATQASFTYHYGDFRGDPEEVLERCFDMMLYIANWGNQQLLIDYLKTIAQREQILWKDVDRLIEEKKAKPYDEAVAILVDLRDLAKQQGRLEAFTERLKDIQDRYKSRTALMQRLKSASLI